MKGLPPPTATQFVKPTPEVQRLHVLSRLEWWHGHIDPVTKQPHRCGGSICGFCDAGRQPELRFVLGVEVRGERRLIELRERHRHFIDTLGEEPADTIGAIVHVWKAGQAKNSPVEFELISRKRCEEWDIRLLVEELGIRPSPPSENSGNAAKLPELTSSDLH